MAMKRSLAVFTRLSPWSVAIGSVFTLFLVACGDSGSSSDSPEKVVLVSSIDELDDCSEYLEGDTVFVKDEKSNFVCIKGKWLNVDSLAAIQNSTNPEGSGSSFVYKQDSDAYVLPPIVQIKNKSISGVSQKGPFVTGSTVKLYELDGKTYASTGKSFPGKIASDDGKFSVSSINLASQYALIEATGYFRNEVTGEKSQGTITLNALTDLSDRKTVNINLLTHLEYDRVLHLVGTGINVRSAKKQAEAEILNAFGIRGKFVNSEDLDIFSKGDGNAALLAFSVLLLGDIDEDEESNEAELTERLTKFATDIEKDGNWNDEKTKAKIADWASSHFYPRDIRENIEDWELGGSIPDFEKYVRNFWYTTYGLGDCGTQNNGVVAPIKNKYSRYSKENEESSYGERQYICKNGEWKWATPLDIDSYKTKTPAKPKDGDLWTGPVTGNTYTYDTDAGGWVIASSPAELRDGVCTLKPELGGCTLKRYGEVVKANDEVYYICFDIWDLDSDIWRELSINRSERYRSCWHDDIKTRHCINGSDSCYNLCTEYQWIEATELEYDTYGKPCTSKDVGSTVYGAVNDSNKYKCVASELWDEIRYYWELEYDPYLGDVHRITDEVENPVDGEMREGDYTLYKYDEELDRWEIANRVEKSLYEYVHHYDDTPDFVFCTTKLQGKPIRFSSSGGVSYYSCGGVIETSECDHNFLCSSHDFNPITELEAETSGNKCSSEDVGKTISGVVTEANKYYCTANGWVSLMSWSWDVPKEARLNPEITYATMTDSRDGKIYKTVTIGDQVWMAENLNYADSTKTPSLKGKSWCYDNEAANCDVTGRLYTWAAAIDSVKLATDTDNPQDCGYGKNCGLTGPVQGICPTGWHLPDTTEWRALFTAVGGSSTASKVLKSQTGWNEGWYSYYNGTDAFGFSALPFGDYFWSSTEHDSNNAYFMSLLSYDDYGILGDYTQKDNSSLVRCLRD